MKLSVLWLSGFAFSALLVGGYAFGNPGAQVPRDLTQSEERRSGTNNAHLPLGLPPLPDTVQWPTKAAVELGKRLFFDRRLSFNNTLSCAMCHLQENAFASNQSAKAVGFEGRTLQRNAPSLLNVAYQKWLFHDGRENHIEWQVWLPLLSPVEMANPSIGSVIERVRHLDDYIAVFEKTYPEEGLTPNTLGHALAAYEITLVSGNSRFDKWRFGNDDGAMSAQEKAGFALFVGKAGCSNCHHIGEQTALFTDMQFHNTGIGYKAMVDPVSSYKVELAKGVFIDVPSSDVERYSEKPINDIGRFAVTLKEEDRWAYKTPTLRDVSKTGPYMHDGSLATLKEVVNYYNGGGYANEGLSGRLAPLNLSAREIEALVAFLKTLDGELSYWETSTNQGVESPAAIADDGPVVLRPPGERE